MPRHTFRLTDENGDDHVLELPVVYEVCDGCRGAGTRVDPAVDGNGLTAEDFSEDPDFREDYFSGQYDVQCWDCHGERVVPHVERAAADPQELALYDACMEAERERARDRHVSRMERMAEMRFGA